MKISLLLEGQKDLEKRLLAERDAKLKGLRKGLLKAGYLLQRLSQEIVPVEFGVLKNSARTNDVTKKKEKPETQVSYGTAYGIYVHENQEAKHAPGKTHHFLTRPLREKKKTLVETIASEAKIQ